LKNGANKNHVSANGTMPLPLAALSGQSKVLEIFLRCGTDPNLTATPDKMTALHNACIKEQVEIVRMLCEHKANVHSLAELDVDSNVTALHLAVMKGNFEIVQILVSFGADFNLSVPTLGSAFETAKAQKNELIVEFFENQQSKKQAKKLKRRNKTIWYVVGGATIAVSMSVGFAAWVWIKKK